MEIRSKTVEGRTYAVVRLQENLPAVDELPHEVDGVDLRRTDAAAVEWLAQATEHRSFRYLRIEGSKLARVSRRVWGAHLEVVEVLARLEQPVDVGGLAELRSLTLAGGEISGDLSPCGQLRSVALGSYHGDSLREFSDCANLESIKVTGHHQVVRPSWAVPPVRLESFLSTDIYLESLAGFSGLKDLRALELEVARPRRELPVVDLSDLRGCQELEWLQVWRAASVRGVDELKSLPKVRGLVVEEGFFSPSDANGLPITVVKARRRPFD